MFSSNSDGERDHSKFGAENNFVFQTKKVERTSIASFPAAMSDVTDTEMVLDDNSEFYWG